MCSGTHLDNKSITTLVTENRDHGQTQFQSEDQSEQSTQQNTQGKHKISSLF